MKTERDKVAAKARRMARDPAVAAAWREGWARVVDVLHAGYAARRPVMKSFEAHHSDAVAREAMLRALVAGKSIAEGEAIALQSVSQPSALTPPPY